MRIEVLHVEDCPHRARTVARVREVVASLGIDAEIHEIAVRTPREAAHLRFPGSPSVRVEGRDIEPDAESRTDTGLACRLYGGSGVPPRALLAAALAAHRDR